MDLIPLPPAFDDNAESEFEAGATCLNGDGASDLRDEAGKDRRRPDGRSHSSRRYSLSRGLSRSPGYEKAVTEPFLPPPPPRKEGNATAEVAEDVLSLPLSGSLGRNELISAALSTCSVCRNGATRRANFGAAAIACPRCRSVLRSARFLSKVMVKFSVFGGDEGKGGEASVEALGRNATRVRLNGQYLVSPRSPSPKGNVALSRLDGMGEEMQRFSRQAVKDGDMLSIDLDSSLASSKAEILRKEAADGPRCRALQFRLRVKAPKGKREASSSRIAACGFMGSVEEGSRSIKNIEARVIPSDSEDGGSVAAKTSEGTSAEVLLALNAMGGASVLPGLESDFSKPELPKRHQDVGSEAENALPTLDGVEGIVETAGDHERCTGRPRRKRKSPFSRQKMPVRPSLPSAEGIEGLGDGSPSANNDNSKSGLCKRSREEVALVPRADYEKEDSCGCVSKGNNNPHPSRSKPSEESVDGHLGHDGVKAAAKRRRKSPFSRSRTLSRHPTALVNADNTERRSDEGNRIKRVPLPLGVQCNAGNTERGEKNDEEEESSPLLSLHHLPPTQTQHGPSQLCTPRPTSSQFRTSATDGSMTQIHSNSPERRKHRDSSSPIRAAVAIPETNVAKPVSDLTTVELETLRDRFGERTVRTEDGESAGVSWESQVLPSSSFRQALLSLALMAKSRDTGGSEIGNGGSTRWPRLLLGTTVRRDLLDR